MPSPPSGRPPPARGWWKASDGRWYPPQTPPPLPPPPTVSSSSTPIGLIGVGVGAAMIIVGSLMPWASLTAPFVGTINKNGTDGDGVLTLLLGLAITGLFCVGLANRARRVPALWIATGAAAAITGAIVMVDTADLAGRFNNIRAQSNLVAVSYGPGLFIVGVGALFAIAGGIEQYARTRGPTRPPASWQPPQAPLVPEPAPAAPEPTVEPSPAGRESTPRGRDHHWGLVAGVVVVGLIVAGGAVAIVRDDGRRVASGRTQATVTNTSPTTTPPTHTSTTAPPSAASTAGPPTAGLDAYLAAFTHVVAHTAAVQIGTESVAVFSREVPVVGTADDREIDVASLSSGQWRIAATIALPEPSFALAPDLPIQVGDVTGDGRPDFLVRLEAADTAPGVVVSDDGGRWRLVPLGTRTSADVYAGRDPAFVNSALVTESNDCVPNCASGTTTPIRWRYDKATMAFVQAS